MSYELCKRISLNEKDNKIIVCIASNNVYPKTYYMSEICGGSHYEKYSFEDKLISLFHAMQTGSIQISTINSNTENFEYAMRKVNEYHKENNINSYEDLYQKASDVNEAKRFNFAKLEQSKNEDRWIRARENSEVYHNWRKNQDEKYIQAKEDEFYLESIWEVYGDSFKVWKKAVFEKIKGQYEAIAYNCYNVTKLGKYDRGYSRFYYGSYNPLKMSYKKAYIFSDDMNNEKRNIKIVKCSE